MIKCEAIIDFDLKDFDKLKNIVRKRKEEYGKVFEGDVFECNPEMADYLGGNNKICRSVIKVIEVIPEENKEDKKTEETIEKVKEKEDKKSKKSKKKKSSKK